MMTACDAHALAISSRATTYDTAPAPLPPHCSGITMPMRPSSPVPLTVSCGKRASRSMSAAIGLIWESANSRTVAWIICCSSVKSSRMGFYLLFQELLELFRELRPLHSAPARDDGLRLRQLGEPGGDLLAALDELHLGAGCHHGRSFDRRRLSGLGVRGAEYVGSQRRDPRRLGPRHSREKLARVDRAGRDKRVPFESEPDRVGGEPDAEPCREPRHELALAARDGRKDRLRRFLGGELGGGRHPHLAPVGGEGRVLEQQYFRGAPLTELLQSGFARLVGEPHGLDPSRREP